jgi:hypothetical protein
LLSRDTVVVLLLLVVVVEHWNAVARFHSRKEQQNW